MKFHSDHDPIVATIRVARPNKDPFTLMYVHASLDTFQKPKLAAEDVDQLLSLKGFFYTLTETGDSDHVRAIKAVVADHRGYEFINPDAGDISFIIDKSANVRGSGGPLAIPARKGPARDGGHGPRHNSYIHFGYNGEHFSHVGCHFVTAWTEHSADGKGHGRMRTDEQVRQAHLMGQMMTNFGRGTDLATGSGDLNVVLPRNDAVQSVFDHYHLTTTAEETGVMKGTHGDSRIDYMWTFDRDHIISVTKMKVLK
jgi:hypothetical protein